MEKMEKIWEFWTYCAEEVNIAVRLNFNCEDIFEETYQFYREGIKMMEEEMFKTKSKNEIVVFRNVCFDMYNNKNDDDIFEEKTFLSCFTDNFNTKYGSIQLKIIIPKGTFHLRKENIIVIPAGMYQFIERCENFYVIKLLHPQKILY